MLIPISATRLYTSRQLWKEEVTDNFESYYPKHAELKPLKTIGMLKKVKLRGLEKVSWLFTFVAAVYNLYRLQRLEAQAT